MRKIVSLLLVLVVLAAPVAATAQNNPSPISLTANLQSTATATGNGLLLGTGQLATVTLQTIGTFVGTVTYEATNDGTHFNTLACFALGSASASTTATAPGIVRCSVAGLTAIRARVSAYTSGSITVIAGASSLPSGFAPSNN